MTGTNCDLFTHKSSRSYLNHLVSVKCKVFETQGVIDVGYSCIMRESVIYLSKQLTRFYVALHSARCTRTDTATLFFKCLLCCIITESNMICVTSSKLSALTTLVTSAMIRFRCF